MNDKGCPLISTFREFTKLYYIILLIRLTKFTDSMMNDGCQSSYYPGKNQELGIGIRNLVDDMSCSGLSNILSLLSI
jgi:hypothetical protein